MRLIISRSIWRKLVVLVIAMVGFVLWYEIRMLDSQYAALQSMIGHREAAPGSRLPFNATAYCKGTTTASGVKARTGVAAADPSLLPVGSVLNVATGDQRYNGVYTVMDTGPKVQGRILDLYMWSCHEALGFGRKDVQVTVLRLGWDPRASSPGLIDRLFRGRESRRQVPPPDSPPPAGVAPEDEAAVALPQEADAPSGDLRTPPETPPPSGELTDQLPSADVTC
jgi:3D (Asp-Asp-Asp) domain-containing protein